MSWQHLSDEERSARKDHRCVWCHEMIPAGTRYRRCSGIMEGDFHSNPFHLECWMATTQYFKTGEDCFDPGSFKRGTMEER